MFTSFFVLVLPMVLVAQSVLISEPMPLRGGEWYEIIGKMKGRYILCKTTYDNKFVVNGYDGEMVLKWTKELEFDSKRSKILNVESTKSDFTVVYYFQDKGISKIKAHKYDPGANLIDSTTIHKFDGSFYDVSLETVSSEDKSKLLFYFLEDNQNKVSAISFDMDSLSVLWGCSFAPNGLPFQRDFLQVLVSNEGEMYFIIGKDNRKNKRNDHMYDIYFGDKESSKIGITFFTFHMRKKLTFDVNFVYDNLNKKIVAGGLYSEKTRTKSVGYFYLNIDPITPDNYRLVFEPFDDEFVSNFLKKEVEANKGLDEAVIQEIILRRDGGILVVGEKAIRSERQTVGAGSMGTTVGHVYYDYYYDDLFVISIHPDGMTHWKTILHKKQYSYDDDAIFSSYFLMKTPKSLSFVFNDEIKYENTVSEYILKGDGNYDRNSILNTKNKKLRLLFTKGVQVSANEIVVPSEHRNRLRLVSIKSLKQ